MAKKITIMGIDFDVDGRFGPDPVSAILGPMPKQEATKMEDVLFGGEKTVRHMKPEKRKSTGKVKAKGKGRRAYTYDQLVAMEKAAHGVCQVSQDGNRIIPSKQNNGVANQTFAQKSYGILKAAEAAQAARIKATATPLKAAEAAAKATTTTAPMVQTTKVQATQAAAKATTTTAPGIINAATYKGNSTGMKVTTASARPKYYVRGYSRTGQPLYAPIGQQQIGEVTLSQNGQTYTRGIWQSPFMEQPVVGTDGQQGISISVLQRVQPQDIVSVKYY